jgi:hypothetical protein
MSHSTTQIKLLILGVLFLRKEFMKAPKELVLKTRLIEVTRDCPITDEYIGTFRKVELEEVESLKVRLKELFNCNMHSLIEHHNSWSFMRTRIADFKTKNRCFSNIISAYIQIHKETGLPIYHDKFQMYLHLGETYYIKTLPESNERFLRESSAGISKLLFVERMIKQLNGVIEHTDNAYTASNFLFDKEGEAYWFVKEVNTQESLEQILANEPHFYYNKKYHGVYSVFLKLGVNVYDYSRNA